MTIYNKILGSLIKVRDERKTFTEHPVPSSLAETVSILIQTEKLLEEEARKYCTSLEQYDPYGE